MKNMPNLNLEERRRIGFLLKKGLTGKEIAQIMFRSINTIYSELRRFKDRPYEPEEAQKEADRRIKDQRDKAAQAIRKSITPRKNSLKRIQSLEMQVEILMDTIKELRKC